MISLVENCGASPRSWQNSHLPHEEVNLVSPELTCSLMEIDEESLSMPSREGRAFVKPWIFTITMLG